MSLENCNLSEAVPVDGSVPTPEDALSIDLGGSLWNSLACDVCHGTIGDGVPQGSSIITSLSRTNVEQVIVDTMPLGNISACDATCATDIVNYLRSINSIEVPVDTGGSGPVDTPIIFTEKQLLKQLYKASMNLLSRVPDQRWVDLVKAQQQVGLELSVNEMLDDGSFYFRLREIYAPLFRNVWWEYAMV